MIFLKIIVGQTDQLVSLQVEADALQTFAKFDVLWKLPQLEMGTVHSHLSVVSISLAGTICRTILAVFTGTIEVGKGDVLQGLTLGVVGTDYQVWGEAEHFLIQTASIGPSQLQLQLRRGAVTADGVP